MHTGTGHGTPASALEAVSAAPLLVHAGPCGERLLELLHRLDRVEAHDAVGRRRQLEMWREDLEGRLAPHARSARQSRVPEGGQLRLRQRAHRLGVALIAVKIVLLQRRHLVPVAGRLLPQLLVHLAEAWARCTRLASREHATPWLHAPPGAAPRATAGPARSAGDGRLYGAATDARQGLAAHTAMEPDPRVPREHCDAVARPRDALCLRGLNEHRGWRRRPARREPFCQGRQDRTEPRAQPRRRPACRASV
mmetsp:Transcript_3870/g.11416  ORF Transcript_3870/g.11416 Transcript_3870/m.11416 type:complete len:252 (-) Transcript_3870:470-1225(-)